MLSRMNGELFGMVLECSRLRVNAPHVVRCAMDSYLCANEFEWRLVASLDSRFRS